LPTARDVDVTPCGFGGYVCDPEQDYWRVSPQSSIWRKAFCKGGAIKLKRETVCHKRHVSNFVHTL
jgi:hypothetical protein